MFLYFHPFFFLQRTIDQTFCTRNIQGFILNHSLSINHHLRHFMLTAAVDTPTPSTWGGFGSGQTSHESSFHFAKFSRLSTNPLRSKSPLCRVILCLLSLKWCIENVLFLVIQESCIKKPFFSDDEQKIGVIFIFRAREVSVKIKKKFKGYYSRAELWRSLGGVDSKMYMSVNQINLFNHSTPVSVLLFTHESCSFVRQTLRWSISGNIREELPPPPAEEKAWRCVHFHNFNAANAARLTMLRHHAEPCMLLWWSHCQRTHNTSLTSLQQSLGLGLGYKNALFFFATWQYCWSQSMIMLIMSTWWTWW